MIWYINESHDSWVSPLFSLLIVCCELDSCLLSPLVASACARPPGMWADITSSAREENKIKYWPPTILKLFHKITGKLGIYIYNIIRSQPGISDNILASVTPECLFKSKHNTTIETLRAQSGATSYFLSPAECEESREIFLRVWICCWYYFS